MIGRRKILSPDHARALIKEAIGKIEGNRTIEAEGTAEIASIETAHEDETRVPNSRMKRCRLHLRVASDGRP